MSPDGGRAAPSWCCTTRPGATLIAVPTSRPRHTVTETDELARALDAAAARWPDEKEARTRLLLRLVEVGHRAIEEDDEARAERRRKVIERDAGKFTGLYPPGYLKQLRDEWPD